ncbi:adenylyltransferase/cytidyltransferase family protein [Cohnella soli]|uniref:Adenylyltransferase/cytidyltransferase family protein n=1 Tax=Cohnella soli TaxID=425005 RepID=A0ABW0I4N0_9BACL
MENGTTVLAGGCFDTFHYGHLEYLTEAKKLGGILIVAMNSDRSFREYKKKEPLFCETQRAGILSHLDIVDYVFLFDEVTLDHGLERIKPNYYVKGIDYSLVNLPELSIVLRLDIEFRALGTKKFASSSQLSRLMT